MKNFILACITLCLITACSSSGEEENKQGQSPCEPPLCGTIWAETKGDRTHWFYFWHTDFNIGDTYYYGECNYEATPAGKDPNKIFTRRYEYYREKGNRIVFIDPNPEDGSWHDRVVYLEGTFSDTEVNLSNDTLSYNLKKIGNIGDTP